MALNGQRPPEYLPVDHKLVDEDIETLNKASKKKDEVYFICYYYYIRNSLHSFRLSFLKS